MSHQRSLSQSLLMMGVTGIATASLVLAALLIIHRSAAPLAVRNDEELSKLLGVRNDEELSKLLGVRNDEELNNPSHVAVRNDEELSKRLALVPPPRQGK